MNYNNILVRFVTHLNWWNKWYKKGQKRPQNSSGKRTKVETENMSWWKMKLWWRNVDQDDECCKSANGLNLLGK